MMVWLAHKQDDGKMIESQDDANFRSSSTIDHWSQWFVLYVLKELNAVTVNC